MTTPRFERVRKLPDELDRALRLSADLRSLELAHIEPRRMRRTERATVYQLAADSPSGRSLFWLKVHTQGRGRARKEYDFLSDLQRVPSVAGVTSVEPVAWLREHDALVMRHADGRHLSGILRNGYSPLLMTRTGLQRTTRVCRRLGQWLGNFHRLWEGQQPPDSVEKTLVETQEVLRRLRGRWKLPKELQRQIETTSLMLAEEVRPEDMISVRAHNDFSTHNILQADDRLVVIDPSFSSGPHELDPFRSRFVDITRFWSTIRGNTCANVRSAKRAELVRAFLDGYNEQTGLAVASSQPVFLLLAMRQLLLSLRDWPSFVGWLLPPTRSATLSWWLSRQIPMRSASRSRC